MSAIRALIIDDDKAVRTVTSCAMPSRGVKVLAAADTSEADEILRHEHVDVIVCDVLMDKEDGLSFCKRLRDEGNNTPLMFLSALGDPVTVSIGMNSGAAAFVVKPFEIGDLCEQITKLVSSPTNVPQAA
jgi:DNA-binding response OmpR family regulator